VTVASVNATNQADAATVASDLAKVNATLNAQVGVVAVPPLGVVVAVARRPSPS